MNKPLTAEEAKNLTFPCLLEVWDFTNRRGHHTLITHITQIGNFATTTGAIWHNAALPSPEIAEAMRNQFAPKSEFPKRMLVWDNNEDPETRIVIADIGEKAKNRYIVVGTGLECEFENGLEFSWTYFGNVKPITEPDPIAQEIEELRQRLDELEAKRNQQSK